MDICEVGDMLQSLIQHQVSAIGGQQNWDERVTHLPFDFLLVMLLPLFILNLVRSLVVLMVQWVPVVLRFVVVMRIE